MDNLQQNIKISDLTTVGIGGPAKYFIEVKNLDILIESLKFAKQNNLEFLMIGSGSNLLVSDDGFDGLIIKNEITGIRAENGNLIVGAGTILQDLVEYTISNGLDGMSTMTGIPGTVGGAVYGSAGAYGDNIRDYLISIKCFDGQNITDILRTDYDTGYRDSIFKHQKNLIILEITFGNFPKAKTEDLKQEAKQILEKRAFKYPPNTKCPGSFFLNIPIEKLSKDSLDKIPPEKIMFDKVPAGYLLETVGAKGDKLGQIKIAENHGNTFINLGGGTALDFYNLAKKYYLKVKERYNLELEPEVQFINLPPLNK